ncbi:unnamed protein product [Ceutorhynchus assimilis]|uniref:Zinc finger PHD-type domain-containing protein n=1 Tax=Ceutorhynchus assimilis TaxID=467358 RepID=A0A9N9MF89_9CUCU|nr:unnamed protein product [Ceutorhynchus assimilis]
MSAQRNGQFARFPRFYLVKSAWERTVTIEKTNDIENNELEEHGEHLENGNLENANIVSNENTDLGDKVPEENYAHFENRNLDDIPQVSHEKTDNDKTEEHDTNVDTGDLNNISGVLKEKTNAENDDAKGHDISFNNENLDRYLDKEIIINNMSNSEDEHVDKEETTNENKKANNIKDKNGNELMNEIDLNLVETAQKEVNSTSDDILKPTIVQEISPSETFRKHLRYPHAINKSSTNKKLQKMPSAISSAKWREYYKKAEEIKNKKTEEVEKRKELRKKAKENKENKKKLKTKTTARKKPSKLMQKPLLPQKKAKIKCAECGEELESETEEEDEMNIGCDNCENWFHMKCTEFYGIPYAEASEKTYNCVKSENPNLSTKTTLKAAIGN